MGITMEMGGGEGDVKPCAKITGVVGETSDPGPLLPSPHQKQVGLLATMPSGTEHTVRMLKDSILTAWPNSQLTMTQCDATHLCLKAGGCHLPLYLLTTH